jgi:cell division protein FtsL
MFFRFLCCVALVVLISLGGVALEKKSLETRRNISQQHYRMEVLRESFAKMRLRVQELGAPEKLIESFEKGDLPLRRPEKSVNSQTKRMPLLHWDSDQPENKSSIP